MVGVSDVCTELHEEFGNGKCIQKGTQKLNQEGTRLHLRRQWELVENIKIKRKLVIALSMKTEQTDYLFFPVCESVSADTKKLWKEISFRSKKIKDRYSWKPNDENILGDAVRNKKLLPNWSGWHEACKCRNGNSGVFSGEIWKEAMGNVGVGRPLVVTIKRERVTFKVQNYTRCVLVSSILQALTFGM